MSNDSYGFLGGNSTPGAKFTDPGASVTGVIAEEPTSSQQTTPKGDLKTWDDGNPMLQLVVTLQTSERDSEIEDDDGKRRLYVKGQMKKAVGDAVRTVGAKGLDVGGTLTVTYTHDGERSNPAFSPPKQYVAVYVAPTGDSAAFLAAEADSEPVPANLPAGMSPEVWKGLTPEARTALAGIAS